MTIYCTTCGGPNVDDARFCSKCGKHIVQPIQEPTSNNVASQNSSVYEQPIQERVVAKEIIQKAAIEKFSNESIFNKPIHIPRTAKRRFLFVGLAVVAWLAFVLIYKTFFTSAYVPNDIAVNVVAEEVEQHNEQHRNSEKTSLQSDPSRFLQVISTETYDKGVVFSYCQLSKITLLNRSHYAVTSVQGEVAWFDSTGGKIGTTTFQLSRSIPAGATAAFEMGNGIATSSTIQGKGKPHVAFTSLEIVE